MDLLKRDCFNEIIEYVSTSEMVVLHGARQVGKTSILRLIINLLEKSKKRCFYMDLEDFRNCEILNANIDTVIQYLSEKGLLENGRLFLFIDEIQYLNNPSSLLKLLHDHYSDKIKLFVSGSSSFEIKTKFKDSLAGRFISFEILPLNFREFLRFKGIEQSLDRQITSTAIIDNLKQLYKEFVCYGGYPKVVLETVVKRKERYLQQVIDTYLKKDIRDIGNIQDVDKFNKLLTVLSSQNGQLLNSTELANSVGLTRKTIDKYLFILENTYIIKILRPFSSNLRSELFKMPKVFFYDSGLANLLQFRTFSTVLTGESFEATVLNDFMKLKSYNDELFYWRTKDKKEIDIICKTPFKLYAIEVKISASKFKRVALDYFKNHNAEAINSCIVFEKSNSNTSKAITFSYSWDIYSLIFPKA